MKKLLAILIAICSAFLVAGLTACDGGIDHSASQPDIGGEMEGYSIEVDLSDFSPIVGLNSEINYGDIKLNCEILHTGDNSTNKYHGYVVNVRKDMIISGGETDTIGESEFVISYAGREFVVSYTVKYKIDFASMGIVYNTQYVLSADEIVIPEALEQGGYTFAGYWETEIPEELTDNMLIEAHYYNNAFKAPKLEVVSMVYEIGSNLSEISLPSNEHGHWVFVDDLSTLVGNVGKNKFAVEFIPANDQVAPTTGVLTVNVTPKQATFVVGEDSFVYDGNSHFPEFTVTDDIEVEILGEAKTEAGLYTFTLVPADSNYEGYYFGSFEITKPSVIITVGSASMKYGEVVPSIEYTVEGFENEDLLAITRVAPNVNAIGSYDLTVTVGNDNVIATVVKGTLNVEKGDLVGVGDPTLSTDSTPAIYESAITTVTLTGDYRGTWEWKNADLVIDSMQSITATVVFTPNNANYNIIEREVTFTNIEKRTLEITIIDCDYVYDGVEHTIVYEIEDGKNVTVDGVISQIGAGSYSTVLSINDPCYKGTKGVTLFIDKAIPATDFTPVKSITWNQFLVLSDVALDDGYTWDAPNSILYDFIGTKSYNATYTPADTANYYSVSGEFSVQVNKAQGLLHGVEESYEFIYDKDNAHSLAGITSTPADSKLISYVYELNGEVVKELKVAGTYNVTVKLAESTYYTAHEETTVVVIKKIVNKDAVITEQGAIYGAKLNSLTLPQNDFGKWSWKDADENTTVGIVGVRTFIAVYTPDDTVNYESREVEIKVTVRQDTIIDPTIHLAKKYVYTGTDIVVFTVAENAPYYSDGNLSAEVFGKYSFTLTLNDSHNFKWSTSDNATITFEYEITQAPNAITSLAITGWVYNGGASANEPTIEASFGDSAAIFYYAPAGTSNYTTDVPVNAGTYNLKAVIAETDNYDAAEKIVLNALVIEKAEYTGDLLAESYEITWSSGVTLAAITGLPEGYSWTNSSTALVAGTTAKYGVTYVDLSNNYNPAYGEFIVTVNKRAYMISAEMKFDSAVTTETTHVYNGAAFTVTASTHGESQPVYTVNGEVTSSVALVNAGTYEIVITIAESEHYLASSCTKTVTIEKAQVTYLLPAWNPSVETTMAELALPAVNEALNGGYQWIWQDLNGNAIDLTQLVGAPAETVEYKLYFASNDNNYKSFAIEVAITVGKIMIVPTLEQSSFVYVGGEAYTVTVLGASDVSYSVTYVTDFVNVGTHYVDLTMSADDYEIHSWAGSATNVIRLTVLITKATNTVEKIEINGWTYGGKVSEPSFESKFGGEPVYTHYNVNNPDEILKGIPENAGTYVLIATSVATENYYSNSKESSPFTIAKAVPVVAFTTAYEATWADGIKLSSITPAGSCDIAGSYAWENAEELLAVGLNEVAIKFVPNDLVNYEIAQATVSVTVNKETASISGVKSSYSTVYNGQAYAISGITASHNEAELEFAYVLNGEPVDEIKGSGTYEVTITLPATAHYNEAIATTIVTVEKADNVISRFEYNKDDKKFILEASYTETGVSYFYKGESDAEFKEWEGEPYYSGFYTIKVVIAESENYKATSATTEIEIVKKIVTPTYVKEGGNVYTGENITVTITLNQEVDCAITCEGATIEGNVVTVVNAGTYEIILTFVGENSNLCVWSEEGINVYSFTVAAATNPWDAAIITADLFDSTHSYNEETNTFTRAYDASSSEVVLPEVDSKYGVPVVSYLDKNGNGITGLPTNAGTYIVIVTVELNNYVAVTREVYLIINAIETVMTLPTYTANQYQDQFPFNVYGYGYNAEPVVKTANSGEVIEGTFEFGDYTIINGINEAGVSVEFLVTFIPNDFNYQSVSETVSVKLKSVAHITEDLGVTRKYYGTVESALKDATAGEVWILPDKTGNVVINDTDGDGIVTIASGVTLVIPFAIKTDDYVPRNEKGGYADTDGRNPEGKVYNANGGQVQIATKSQVDSNIILKAGVTLSVSGTLEIAGRLGGGESSKFFAGQTYMDYAQMTLEDGAEIVVNDGGKLNLTGYIRGDKGQVTIDYGADLYIPFVLNDHHGGTYFSKLATDKKAAVFNRYQFRNIEKTLLRINYGGEMYVYANLFGDTSASADGSYNHAEALFISSTGISSKTAVINLTKSGSYLTSTFTPGDYGENNYPYLDFYKDLCELNIYGGATLEQLSLTLMDATVSSKNFDFPVPIGYDITLHDGSYSINNKLKLLPGAKLTVEEDANLTATKLSVYNYCHFVLADFGDHKFYCEAATNIPAELWVNGTFTCDEFGGSIYTNNPGAKVTISKAGTSVQEAWAKSGSSILTTAVYTTYNHTLELDVSGAPGEYYTAAGTYYSDGSAWFTTGSKTVTYNANGGAEVAPKTFTSDINGFTITADYMPSTTKNYYNFAGWYLIDAEGNEVDFEVGTVLYNDVTVYARWVGQDYTVDYSSSLGNTPETETFTYSVDKGGELLPELIDDSGVYNFAGWFTTADFSGLAISNYDSALAAADANNTVTLYAKWTSEVQYTVTFVSEYNVNKAESKKFTASELIGVSEYFVSDLIGDPTIYDEPSTVEGYYYGGGWVKAGSSELIYEVTEADFDANHELTLYVYWIKKLAISGSIQVIDNASDADDTYTASYELLINGVSIKKESSIKTAGTHDFTYYVKSGATYEVKGTNTSGNVVSLKSGTVTANVSLETITVYCDNTAKKQSGSCFTGDTLITLADGTQKRGDQITLDDELLVFNHETGKYEAAGIIFIENDGMAEYNVIHLEFSDGTTTKLIYEHGYFDLTLNEYVYITEDNYADFVGHEFAVMDGDSYRAVTLVNSFVAKEYTGCYSLVTVYHLNYFVDGLFSMPGGITGLFNMFEFGEGLVFDEAMMQADIEEYGLYTYEDFAEYLPYEVYAAFPAPQLKVSVGKGMITFEEILGYIEKYLVKNDVI